MPQSIIMLPAHDLFAYITARVFTDSDGTAVIMLTSRRSYRNHLEKANLQYRGCGGTRIEWREWKFPSVLCSSLEPCATPHQLSSTSHCTLLGVKMTHRHESKVPSSRCFTFLECLQSLIEGCRSRLQMQHFSSPEKRSSRFTIMHEIFIYTVQAS
jgi:hypothetical protein